LVLRVAAAVPADRFTFQSIHDLIANHQVETVEQLLAALPQELRAHYTLVFSSRSLQDANPQSPRAILFGTDALLIITFNGERSQRGYESVETMEFSSETNTFSFREISFTADSSPGTPQISDPNPARCVACHDNPARPIWDTPPVWPGVYGERYGAGLSSAELRGIRGFVSSQPTHARYRYLLDTNTLADRDRYLTNSRASYNGQSIEPPNSQLSALLATLNVRSILASLAERPAFSPHLHVLLAAAGDTCGSISDFYPAFMRNDIAAEIRQFSASAAAADRRQALSKTVRRAGRADARTGLAHPTELTALRFVAERSLGVPTQHWTLAFERGSYDLSAPPSAVTFERALFNWLVRTDPQLAVLASYRTYDESDAYCAHLRQASQASLADWYTTHYTPTRSARAADAAGNPNEERTSTPALLQTCIACHSNDAAPRLPFAAPELLATLLREGHYPHGRLLDEILFRLTPRAGPNRMPRGIDIDDAQQHQLENYFMDLAGPSGVTINSH
jgi:mono/diheme cytochrome c family protein